MSIITGLIVVAGVIFATSVIGLVSVGNDVSNNQDDKEE